MKGQLPAWLTILILVLTPIIILYVFGDIKPNGEYDCGERSANLSIEQQRIVCENQHYNITGKNRTTIGGVETYCCPSPWIPNEHVKSLCGWVNPLDPTDETFGCSGPVGSPQDANFTLPDNSTIILNLSNGTKIEFNVFKNGTVKEARQ